ncbi:MAG TPA: DinB family protein, partial [Herpetosiphonaceae bacterium]
AAKLREVHAQLDDELATILADAQAEETTRQPAPGEWSAVEVIAHLVATAREFQIAQAFQLSDMPLDRFPDNPPAWVQSILGVHPTSGELLNLLKQTERETEAMVAALPAEFVANKIGYLNLTATLLQNLPGHSRLHFEQIQAAIAAARAAIAAE